MKKLLITLLAAFMVSGAVVAQETPFPDIPAGHWAADAVARIADLGIVIGFPDGTFRGNESFTRYQAALVVSRLLDVVNANIAAAQAMTDADLASLRNAVQELAADLAAQGATVAAIADDVSANNARIEAIEEAIASGGLDPEVIEDLQNQLASLRVAADTAQARADQALAVAQGLESQVAQNTADIAVLEELVTRLNDDVMDLLDAAAAVEGTGVPAGLLARVERNESDIANIREFVILLRRDQVALRNRVSAIEDVNARQDEELASLDERVTELERNAFTISGSLELFYDVGRLSGDELPIDVDRIWGLNNERDLAASPFSSGEADFDDDDESDEVGDRPQDVDDIEFAEGAFDTDLTLTFAFARNGQGGSDVITDFEVVLELGVQQAFNLDEDADQELPADDEFFDGYVFVVEELTTTFTVGNAPITIQFGEEPEATFTPYVFDAEGDGFVATVGSPDFLAFLDPTLTLAYGEYDRDVIGDSADDFEDAYYRGARLTLSPFQDVTLGASFAQLAEEARENADAAGDNEEITVIGVDGQAALSIFDVSFEYAQSSGTIDTDEDGVDDFGSDSALLFVEVGVDGESIPLLESLTANYRDIPGAWAGIESDDGDYPYELDQAGFGVEATLDVFIVDVTAYFDTYVTGSPDASATAFGVDATAELFAAFSLTGFYHSASIDGTLVDDLDSGVDADEVVVAAEVDRNDNYATEFGVELTHDGSADDALIPNLNITAAYTQAEADFSESTISVEADYTLGVSILTLTPYVGYETVSDSDVGADDTTTLKVGTGLETAALDVFTSPSLIGAVNYRTTDHSEPDYTATEFQYSVGLQLNEFLFDNSVLTARYGSWSGTNIEDDITTTGGTDFATDISGGDESNGLTQSTSGYEITWTYFDLAFAYGAYSQSIADATGTVVDATGAQAFSISYTINF